ncbi:MAG: hypothetical protein ACYDDE_00435 [bacterium]
MNYLALTDGASCLNDRSLFSIQSVTGAGSIAIAISSSVGLTGEMSE